jgi:multiple sugar transport system permease protein
MISRIKPMPPITQIIVYTILVIVGLGMAYPFFYLISTALKTNSETVVLPLVWWPSDAQWNNFGHVMQLPRMEFVRPLLNTIFVSGFVTVGQIVTSIMGGYAFARLRFPGRNVIFVGYLGSIMIPFVVLMVPLYQLMKNLHWIDSLTSLTVPWIFSAYGTFLFRQFFLTVPNDLEEAAVLDGANRWTILWRIFVPLSGPIIATQATFTFLYAWNSFLWPLIMITSPENKVLPLWLIDLQGGYYINTELVMAGSTLVILPTILVFLLAQRYFVEGIATTGLK